MASTFSEDIRVLLSVLHIDRLATFSEVVRLSSVQYLINIYVISFVWHSVKKIRKREDL